MSVAVIVAALLAQIADPRAVAREKLEAALKSPDVRVRLTAVHAIPRRPCADVEALLRIASADEKFNVRLAVVDKLDEIGAGIPGGCADLRPIATYDDDLSLAEYRTHRMHGATPETGVECSSKADWTALKAKCVQAKALKAIMRGPHKEARYWAAMRAMAEAPAVKAEALRVIRGALYDRTPGPKRPGVEKTEGWAVRWAPLMLEHVPDPVRIPILERALRYRGDGNVSTNAVDAIGKFDIASARKLALLEKAARHKFAQVRWRAARAYGGVIRGDESGRGACATAERQLRSLLNDKSWWVRRAAAREVYGGDSSAGTIAAADRCEAMRHDTNDALDGKCLGKVRKPSLYDISLRKKGVADAEPIVRLCAIRDLVLHAKANGALESLRESMESSDFRVSLRAAGAVLGGER